MIQFCKTHIMTGGLVPSLHRRMRQTWQSKRTEITAMKFRARHPEIRSDIESLLDQGAKSLCVTEMVNITILSNIYLVPNRKQS